MAQELQVDPITGEIIEQEISLALPGRLTPITFELPQGLTRPQWEQVGNTLSVMDGAVHWWIGDWLNYGERMWGEKYKEAIEQTGFSYNTVRVDQAVARDFQFDRRRSNLTFSHHREVLSLEAKEQEHWLDKAAEDNWSTRKLRQQVKSNGHNGAIMNAGLYDIEDSTVIVGDARDMDLSQFPSRYHVIIADPPWHYNATTGRGIAEDHYNGVLAIEDLKAMPISELAEDDCVLFMWGTWPMLPDVLSLISAWDFEYKTGLPYVKMDKSGEHPYYGVGRWVRGATEYVLICVRGSVSPPAELKNYMGIMSPNLEHSRKPNDVHELAETLEGPYLELFARRSRPGWTVFGNEIQGMLCK